MGTVSNATSVTLTTTVGMSIFEKMKSEATSDLNLDQYYNAEQLIAESNTSAASASGSDAARTVRR